jgi:hypothetical protein
MRQLRILLQVVLFFLLLGVVVGIGAQETGTVEKLVLVPIGLGLVWLAAKVRGLGRLVAGD